MVFLKVFEGAEVVFELQVIILEGWGDLGRQGGDLGRLWLGLEPQKGSKMEVCWP